MHKRGWPDHPARTTRSGKSSELVRQGGRRVVGVDRAGSVTVHVTWDKRNGRHGGATRHGHKKNSGRLLLAHRTRVGIMSLPHRLIPGRHTCSLATHVWAEFRHEGGWMVFVGGCRWEHPSREGGTVLPGWTSLTWKGSGSRRFAAAPARKSGRRAVESGGECVGARCVSHVWLRPS